VVENLGLSYRNARELNRIIDAGMPGRPKFKCEEIHIAGEACDFYFRDIIPSIRALFGDPSFAGRLVLAPERHYQDADHTTQVFSEMHTGKWWWSVQVCLHISLRGLLLTKLLAIPCVTQPWRDSDTCPPLIGQDTTHTFSIQKRLPRLHVDR
jgi:Plavaka transposase